MHYEYILCSAVSSVLTATSNNQNGSIFCLNADIYFHCKIEKLPFKWSIGSEIRYQFRNGSPPIMQDNQYYAAYFVDRQESILVYPNATENLLFECDDERLDIIILRGNQQLCII